MDQSFSQETATETNWVVREAHATAASVVDRIRSYSGSLLCALLLAVMGLQLLAVISRKSITNDEVVSIPAGYYHLVDGNFHISIDHPPLTKMWAALPLLLIQPKEPTIELRPSEDAQTRTVRAQAEFWKANSADFKTISLWARVPMIALTLMLGLLIFIYTRQLFGPRAAVFAVALFTVEPTVLAHGRTALNDLPAALGYLLFFFTLYAYLKTRNLRNALFLGATAGLAMVIKFSLIVVAPIFICIAIVTIWIAPRCNVPRKRVAMWMGLATLLALLVINSAYYFQRQPPEESEFRWLSSIFSITQLPSVMKVVNVISVFVPSYFFTGVDAVLARNRYGQPSSLLGMESNSGWVYYFPVAFALKTSLPFLLTSVGALFWACWRFIAKREKQYLILLVPFGIYVAIAMSSTIDIGIRHLLPAYPFLFILSGAFLDSLFRTNRTPQLMLVLVVLLSGWFAVEAVRAFPDHMSYMNELTWRHPRWYYLSDSNVEWGDDVAELANYLHEQGETKVRASLLGGWATLPYYGIEYIDAHVPDGVQLPDTRYIAIGASFLNGSTTTITKPGRRRIDYFAEYRDRVPEAVFGNSIYLYREK